MAIRKIFCAGCNMFIGEIRDATLRKGMVVLCKDCEKKRQAADLAMRTKPKDQYERFMDMVGGKR